MNCDVRRAERVTDGTFRSIGEPVRTLTTTLMATTKRFRARISPSVR
jgi:hypothetical protein